MAKRPRKKGASNLDRELPDAHKEIPDLPGGTWIMDDSDLIAAEKRLMDLARRSKVPRRPKPKR